MSTNQSLTPLEKALRYYEVCFQLEVDETKAEEFLNDNDMLRSLGFHTDIIPMLRSLVELGREGMLTALLKMQGTFTESPAEWSDLRLANVYAMSSYTYLMGMVRQGYDHDDLPLALEDILRTIHAMYFVTRDEHLWNI